MAVGTRRLKGGTAEAPGRIRLLFFSDWRLQPLQLLEGLLEAVGPVDVIVYGGDDVGRFGGRDMGDNWLARIGSKSRFGVVAVLGNDDDGSLTRPILNVPGVRDLHKLPMMVDGWGFVGVEGSIRRRRTTFRPYQLGSAFVNDIGFLKHNDREIPSHLRRATRKVGVKPENLVIVSHTPPFGILDIGVRFGLEHLGSAALAEFISQNRPALVLCGHCHSRGGRCEARGSTLVVNGASDDRKVGRAHVSLVDLSPDEPPRLSWLDPRPHSVVFVPEIGPKRAKTLAVAGITRPNELFAATDEVLKSIGFGETRKRRLLAYRQSVEENRAVWLSDALRPLPSELIFYDVETGLAAESPLLGGAYGNPEPWMIGAMGPDSAEVKHWLAVDETREARLKMLRGFLDYVGAYPNATLCAWSGTGFDKRAVGMGLARWDRNILERWESLPEIDLAGLLKRHVVLPVSDWSVKTVGRFCGLVTEDGHPSLDGFEVGLAYEMYRQYKEPMPLDEIAHYNARDVLAVAQVAKWVREQQPPCTGRIDPA